jgi:hypothetical protein
MLAETRISIALAVDKLSGRPLGTALPNFWSLSGDMADNNGAISFNLQVNGLFLVRVPLIYGDYWLSDHAFC